MKNPTSAPAHLSVVIPTYKRTETLQATLQKIESCSPHPAEVVVHIDAGDRSTGPALSENFPQVVKITSEKTQGPGGARNKLLQQSTYEIVVSLDDDSYPIDKDFFTVVLDAFNAHPEAGVLAMSIIHDDEPLIDRHSTDMETADFIGCGCAYRKTVFQKTAGYLPLHPAYGMEEADVGLQIADQGWKIIQIGNLRVRHATNRNHQTSRKIVAAHVRNTALLAYLRYPFSLSLYGTAQVINRVRYSALRGHLLGAIVGLAQIPATLIRHKKNRAPVSYDTVIQRRALRHRGLG